MSTNEQVRVTHAEASQALDSMDDFARMSTGVDAHGPRGVLERYIAQQAATLRQSADSGRVGDEVKLPDPETMCAMWTTPTTPDAESIAFLAGARQMRAALEAALAAQGQGEPEEISPEFTDSARGAIAWVLCHHQGGSSPVGQPLRFALGMGAHEPLPSHWIEQAKRWAKWSGATTEQFHPAPAASQPDDETLGAIAMLEAMAQPDGGSITKQGAARIAATIRRLAACAASPAGGAGW